MKFITGNLNLVGHAKALISTEYHIGHTSGYNKQAAYGQSHGENESERLGKSRDGIRIEGQR